MCATCDNNAPGACVLLLSEWSATEQWIDDDAYIKHCSVHYSQKTGHERCQIANILLTCFNFMAVLS